MTAMKKLIPALLLFFLAQGCVPAQQPQPEVMEVESTATVENQLPVETSTPLPTATAVPTATEVLPTPQPMVTIHAVSGNLYIRRGPGIEYDRIGVLTKGTSAEIIGQDVLSKWVQVNVPDSDRTGWVSIMTEFSQVDGDLSLVADFTFTDWPKPAYIKNCTEHDILIQPGEIYLYNLWTNGQFLNEAQVNPGTYTVYDMFVPGEPEIETVDVREGMTIYITVNGEGVKHNCP